MNTREDDLLAVCKKYLTLLENRGILWFLRNNTGLANYKGRCVPYGRTGSPDLIVGINGKFVGIELKSTKGKQNKEQLSCQRAIERAGCNYVVCRTFEEVKAVIEAEIKFDRRL